MPFQTDQILQGLAQNKVKWITRLEYFETIDSSNTYLLNSLESVHGCVCVADYQTRGKGRQGKQWHSSAGRNLMFSLGWAPTATLKTEISLVVGVALVDVLRQAGFEGVGLKWPNDVMVDDKKLAGVLVETRIFNKRPETVIGVGLNIQHNQIDKSSTPKSWTDLSQLSDSRIDRQALLIKLLSAMSERLMRFEAQGFSVIRKHWLRYHLYQGADVSYQHKGEARTGTIKGVNALGALMLESSGVSVEVSSGEVHSLRRSA